MSAAEADHPRLLPPGRPSPVTDWLDSVGLPWRSRRADLIRRYGVTSDNPWQWDCVSMAIDPPPLKGMLAPFDFGVLPMVSPEMPPVSFSAHISVGDDAGVNIRFAQAQFASCLGDRAIVRSSANTLGVTWRWEAASVALLVWPPELQDMRMTNPAHARDPRLVTACHVAIETGWRPPLSGQDRDWLDHFAPMPVPDDLVRQPWHRTADVEFMRETYGEGRDFSRYAFGLSSDGQALIFRDEALFIIPVAPIASFELVRLLPAKGGGGSSLAALFDTGDPAWPTKHVSILRAAGPDSLTAAAEGLASAVGKPLIAEEAYDC